MQEAFQIAGGIVLALYTVRVVDWVKDAPKRAHRRRKVEELDAFMHQMAHDLAETIKTKKPTRRKPAAKRGATNAKATPRR